MMSVVKIYKEKNKGADIQSLWKILQVKVTRNCMSDFRISRVRTYFTVTHKALAFPASSAHQTCGVVSLQPVKHWYQLPVAFSGLRRNTRTLRRDGAADDDRSAG